MHVQQQGSATGSAHNCERAACISDNLGKCVSDVALRMCVRKLTGAAAFLNVCVCAVCVRAALCGAASPPCHAGSTAAMPVHPAVLSVLLPFLAFFINRLHVCFVHLGFCRVSLWKAPASLAT